MFCRSLILSLVTLFVHGKPVQLANLQLPTTAAANKQAVVDLFTKSYGAYRQYAWGHDDLLPISKSFSDGRNGWGSSMADALDTMWIMGLHDWFEEAVDHIATVDFNVSRTDDTVNLFETTIRYVGGFLSAYELSGKQYNVLVKKAEQLGEGMAYGWVGDNEVPYNTVNFTNHKPTVATTSIAGAGTLVLEWNRLSLYTNNDTYRKLAEEAMVHIIKMSAPLPGMPGQLIDPSTGDSGDSYVTWGGGSDSYFEYLIKYPRLTNADDNYADAWLDAVDSSMKVLLETSTIGNWIYLADFDDNKRIRHVSSHLACFAGGNWIFGGKLANNDTIVDIGLKLTDACWNTYASTSTGIGPEDFAYISSDGSYTGGSAPTTDEINFYAQHGFYITGSDYILRPEVLESNFYAWRATGDTKYLDNAASAIKSFQKYLPAAVAYGGIDDVNNATSTKIDDMESFWFAEVLKYLYLTFDEPENYSLDNYVFNTECHPFETLAAKSVYGTVA